MNTPSAASSKISRCEFEFLKIVARGDWPGVLNPYMAGMPYTRGPVIDGSFAAEVMQSLLDGSKLNAGGEALKMQVVNASREPCSRIEALLRMCDSYSRLPALLCLVGKVEESEWLKALGEEWPCIDNVGTYRDELLGRTPLGKGDSPVKEMMNDEELAILDSLHFPICVFRGCYRQNENGLSWTTDREIAIKFPTLNRYRKDGQPLLIEATASRSDVIAFKGGRDESELVLRRFTKVCETPIQV
ncbi:hypothetical protein [Planctomycetes bacterium TBK1r]|uniref:Uncharacterized protein n=1 Tax=Stieleria magnilauensis TaxID=2527963 RepID=A0ABX5Y2J2_9BACT|nr:hypothetical protein TBK1r_64450 [Planctomycetes bacterium TBK1r]